MAVIITSEVFDDIKSILKKHSIPIKLKCYVDFSINKSEGTIKWKLPIGKLIRRDKISEYLNQHVFNPYNSPSQTFYHYLPKHEYLENILEKGEIRLNSLNKYLGSDCSEYRHFLEDFGISFPKYEEQVNSIKDETFIWCLTDRFNSKKHWKEFANNRKGVAIGVKYVNISDRRKIIDFVKVCYDLPFLREIQSHLQDRFNLKLEIGNYTSFAKFYKKKCFDWESEYRLSFDNGFKHVREVTNQFFKAEDPFKRDLDTCFTIHSDEKHNYIRVPLKNPFFEVTVTDVYCTSAEQRKRALRYQQEYYFKIH